LSDDCWKFHFDPEREAYGDEEKSSVSRMKKFSAGSPGFGWMTGMTRLLGPV
jgi:hypothetical protein